MAVPAHFFQCRGLAEAGHVGVIAHTFPAPPGMVGIGDTDDVFIGEFAMRAVDHPAHLTGVDEEHFAVPVARKEPQARGDLGRVEELARQRHHAVHQIGLDQTLANCAFAGLARCHRAVGEHKAGHAARRQMMDDMLHPGKVGVSLGWSSVLPSLVLGEPLAAPVGDVEGGIGEDKVGLEVGMAVVVEAVALGDLSLDAPDGEVHPGEPPGRVVRFLTVDRDIGPGSPGGFFSISIAAGVRTDEFDRLHEHAGGTAAGVVDPAPVGLQHLNQQLDHAARRVELAAFLALGTREPRQEVLVDAAEHIRGPGSLIAYRDVTDEVDNLAEPLLVERGAGVVLGEHALERRVVALYAGHRLVDKLADGGLPGLGLEMCPARLGRHPEDVVGAVFIRVFRISALLFPFTFEDGVLLLEGIRDIFQKDEAKDDMLVFSGIHAAPQGVGHAPQVGLTAGCCPAAARFRIAVGCLLVCSCSRHAPSFLFSSLRQRQPLHSGPIRFTGIVWQCHRNKALFHYPETPGKVNQESDSD